MKKNILPVLLWVILTSILFFFAFFYKYHLYFVEQSRLFLMTEDSFRLYLKKPAVLSSLVGDFLTQFYYLRAGGPVVITLTLIILGTTSNKVLSGLISHRIAGVLTLGIVIFHALLHCDLNYPLSSTISLVFIFLVLSGYYKIKDQKFRWGISIIMSPILYLLVGGYFILFLVFVIGYEIKNSKGRNLILGIYVGILSLCVLLPAYLRTPYKLTNTQAYLYPNTQPVSLKPDFKLERILGMDYEWYYHKPEKVIQMAQECNFHNRLVTYYYNMAQASIGQLPDHLLDFYQPGINGLYIPLDRSQNYLTIGFANEVYFLTGDVNSSQHCAILGSTFSPQNASPRFMTRVVETNIINGEYAVAIKYIKILEHTLFHKRWASKMRRYLNDSLNNQIPWIMLKRQQLVKNDYVRVSPNDFEVSLIHLVQDHPENQTARNYLLCYYLLSKDIDAFYRIMHDYGSVSSGIALPVIYQQALLIYFAKHPNDPDRNQFHFSRDIFNGFINYSEIFANNSGNGSGLQQQYGKTYWFYYHFAVLKNEGKL